MTIDGRSYEHETHAKTASSDVHPWALHGIPLEFFLRPHRCLCTEPCSFHDFAPNPRMVNLSLSVPNFVTLQKFQESEVSRWVRRNTFWRVDLVILMGNGPAKWPKRKKPRQVSFSLEDCSAYREFVASQKQIVDFIGDWRKPGKSIFWEIGVKWKIIK